MKQTHYSVKISTYDKITTLKCLQGFLEIVGFTKKKEIQGLLSTIIENVLFFKDFKALKKQR